MPDAIITSTASTFGTISGTFAADQSTITGTVSGIVPGTLSGSVGVPGPAGSPGAPGVGVPAGGTAGQYLQKIDGTNYNTDWVTVNLSGYALLSGAEFTGRVTVPSTIPDGEFSVPGFNIVPTQNEVINMVDGDLWVYDDEGDTPSKFRVFLAGNTQNIATESWVSSLYAPIVSPVFTGDPRAPTPATSDNDTSIATTAFVKAQGYAPLASPAFTGNPTAPTAALADNDTSIATTAFVQQELLSGTANARNLEVYVRNQTGSTIPAGSIVYINGATGNRPTITLAQANNDANSAQTLGFTKTSIANNGFGFVIVRGEVENLNTSSLTEGVQLYLSPTTAGAYTTTKPSAPQHLVYVGICVRAHPTQGVILVAVQNGYELEELHDVSITSLANNNLLAYESSTDLWKNKTFSALGLLTSADAASTYAPLASPTFTGTPSLPTGTTAVTQTVGDNTTKLATTAFVLANAGSTSFATSTQSRAATSTTVAQSPSTSLWQAMSPGMIDINRNNLTYAATGTMGTSGQGFLVSRMTMGTAGAASANFRTFGTSQIDQSWALMSKSYRSYIDFSKFTWCSGRFYMENAPVDPLVTAAFYYGKANNSANGNLARKGFGWKLTGNATAGLRNPVLQVHNGTTLTNVTSSFAAVAQVYWDWDIISLGDGNVTLYINGTQVATTSAGPTGDTSYSGTAPVIWNEELLSTGVTAGYDAVFGRGRIYVAP